MSKPLSEMTNLLDLLKLLADLDPALCEVVSANADTFRLKLLPDLLGWYWIELNDGQLSLRDTAVLQFAIQQAIGARGWDYRLESYVMDRERQYSAWVYPGGQALGKATEATALLSAYVGALGQLEKGAKL